MADANGSRQGSTRTNSLTSRRALLSSIGAGLSLVGLSSADTFPKQLFLYLHSHSRCGDADWDVAVSGAYSFRDQFNDSFNGFEMNVREQPGWDGDYSRNTLENSWEYIPEVVDPSDGDGIHHFLVYEALEDIDDPLDGASEHGYGHNIDYLSSSENGASVTNIGAARRIDGEAAAKNLFIHETLHALAVEHKHGSVGAGMAFYKNISPMATAYVRSSYGLSDTAFKGTGDTPNDFCNGTNNYQTKSFEDYTTAISSCSINQVSDHLHSEYDIDYPDRGCGSNSRCPI